MSSRAAALSLLVSNALATACSAPRDRPAPVARDTVLLFAAASLAAPCRSLLDTFARQDGALVQEEHGASLELARRVTELHRVPDAIALADQEVFPQLLLPSATAWYARFARNRMVVAFTDRSRRASEMTADGWWRTLQRDDVLLGRTDPELAPAGYRALLMYELAERYYRQPGLAARLSKRTSPRLQRGNAAELAGLLEAGELDYIVDYESLARAHHFRWIALPPDIDLGDERRATQYASVSVRVRRGRDSVTLRGAPILYAVTVPRDAPHEHAGERFVALMLGADGRALLRRENVDALDRPQLVGDSIPAIVRAAVAR